MVPTKSIRYICKYIYNRSHSASVLNFRHVEGIFVIVYAELLEYPSAPCVS